MDNIQEKAAVERKKMIPGRLMKGAGFLGQLWREGQRCASGGWTRYCRCAKAAKTQFCQVKITWVELLLEFGPSVLGEMTGDEEYFVLEVMDPKAFKASGLTIKITAPDAPGSIWIGPKGTFFKTLEDIVAAGPPGSQARNEMWATVVKVQEAMR